MAMNGTQDQRNVCKLLTLSQLIEYSLKNCVSLFWLLANKNKFDDSNWHKSGKLSPICCKHVFDACENYVSVIGDAILTLMPLWLITKGL